MVSHMISALLDEEAYKKGKESGLKWSSIIAMGLAYLENKTAINNEIEELKSENKKRMMQYYALRKDLTQMQEDFFKNQEVEKCGFSESKK